MSHAVGIGPKERSLADAEAKLSDIKAELESLAKPTPRVGVGNLGWSSRPRRRSDHKEWVSIEFDGRKLVDQIVLVPVIWRDPSTGIKADAFPEEFEVIAGVEGSEETVLASFSAADEFLPRVAPLVIPVTPISCDWIKVRASRLSPRYHDGRYVFQLAEIFAFSGAENVALHAAAKSSSSYKSRVRNSYSLKSIVDGVTPYVMDASGGQASQSCVLFYERGIIPSLVFDLGATHLVNRLHLHASDFGESIPQIRHADYGLPRSMLIEGARDPEFSNPVELANYQRDSIYELGPLVALQFSPTRCRFIRFIFNEGYRAPEARDVNRCVGFTEVEVFSAGENVAQGVLAKAKGELLFKDGELSSLTDGKNHFGSILSTRNWMEQLARRHDLSLLEPIVAQEVLEGYRDRGKKLKLFMWASVLIAAALAAALYIGRKLRKNQIERIKRRFVADLHDEVGANLHAIGILSDVIRGRLKPEDKVQDLLDEVRLISQETSEATRHCTSMVEATGVCEDLEAEMRRSAKRMLLDVEYEIEVIGAENLRTLLPRRKIDLLLFFKECLANVIRHSHASLVEIELAAQERQIFLHVRDNGEGTGGKISSSLRRRARLLRAKLNVETEKEGGTCVSLCLKTSRFGF